MFHLQRFTYNTQRPKKQMEGAFECLSFFTKHDDVVVIVMYYSFCKIKERLGILHKIAS